MSDDAASPASPASPAPPAVPDALIPTLSHQELLAFLRAKHKVLEDYLLPGVSAALVLQTKEAGATEISVEDLFEPVPVEKRAELIALKILLSKIKQQSEAAKKKSSKKERQRLAELERIEKAKANGTYGKSPTVLQRPWMDIISTARTNKTRAAPKIVATEEKQRAALVANGAEVTFGCPAEGNYQMHHAFLLGSGEEHMAEVLSTLGSKLVRWSAQDAQLTVHFSGEALDGFFKKLDKESKTPSAKVVTTQQVHRLTRHATVHAALRRSGAPSIHPPHCALAT